MPGNGNSGGRNKTATDLHLLRGTFRSDRHADHASPDPPKGEPARPKGLNAIGRAEWDRMVGRLTETGALAKVDDAALYQYCQLFAETEGIRTDTLAIRRLSSQLKQAIQKLNGDALVRAVGEIVKLQALIAKETQQLRQGHMALRQYLVEFGMTPAARPRVKLPKTTAPASKLEAFRHRGSSGAWPPPKP